jgi:hypothetical protein
MIHNYSKNIHHLQKMKETTQESSIMLLYDDILCNIVYYLPIESMKNLAITNKKLYEYRKNFIASNKIIIDFEKTKQMSYLDTFYNSHIMTLDSIYLKCHDKLTNITSDSIYNTQIMISYIIKIDSILSITSCNNTLFNYILKVFKYKYKYINTPKIYAAYCGVISRKEWWNCKISLYNIYECLSLTKQRKYKQLQHALENIQMSKIDNIDNMYSFMITFSLLMDCININYDAKSRAVLIYILYNYIEYSSECMKHVKRSFIDVTIDKSDEFIHFIMNNIKMPKYIKEMINKKLLYVNEMLRGIRQISYTQDS